MLADERSEIIQALENSGTIAEAAKLLGIPRTTLNSRLERNDIKAHDYLNGKGIPVQTSKLRHSLIDWKAKYYNQVKVIDALNEEINRPRPHKIKFNKRRDLSKVEHVRVCFGDMHGVHWHKESVEAMLADIRHLKPDEIIIGGDMLDCDTWLSTHDPKNEDAHRYAYVDDISIVNSFLNELQESAPSASIDYIEGNHEQRVRKFFSGLRFSNPKDIEFMAYRNGPEGVLRLRERGIKFWRCDIQHGKNLPVGWIKKGKMHFVHQLSGGKHAASTSLQKAGCNITFFHTHRQDVATTYFPVTGMCGAYNPGCLCDTQPTYMGSNPSTWVHGYGIDFVGKGGDFQRIHIQIKHGKTLLRDMFKKRS